MCVFFPLRAGAECGGVQERLPAPEGGEPVQAEGAEAGKNWDSGLRSAPGRAARVTCSTSLRFRKHSVDESAGFFGSASSSEDL